MAGGNNGGEVRDLTLEILKNIQSEMGSMRHEMGSMRHEMGSIQSEMGSMRDEMGSMRHEMRAGFQAVDARFERVEERQGLHSNAIGKLIGEVSTLNSRFDNFLTGAHRAEHDELRGRIERIEERLDTKTG